MAHGAQTVTPLQFEDLYGPEWQELEFLLDHALERKKSKAKTGVPVRGDRVAALYRRACEHLALARERGYPSFLLDRLDRLTSEAHQLIYQRRELGVEGLLGFITTAFPRAVRAHAPYVWISATALLLPTIVIGLLVYSRPDLILSLVSTETAASFEDMYSDSAESIGRMRGAESDWMMFGYYINNNIGIAFQCFAGGLLASVGSLFFLLYNGALLGGVAGYLTRLGLASTFYSFVVTHSAFELTAIILSGAAGLRLGYAILAPGRLRRLQSLVIAARESVVIIYGVTALLLVAAALEAFWSSAKWLPHAVKYGVASACWLAVLGYLTLQGRSAD